MDGGVEAFWVDALHELEALRGRFFDRRPPDGAGVVDEDVETAVYLCKSKNIFRMGAVGTYLDGPGNKPLHTLNISHVHNNSSRISTRFPDLPLNGTNRRLRGFGVWREGMGIGRITS